VPKAVKTLGPKELVKMLMDAKEFYYAGKPIMEDSEFDRLEDDLRKIDPQHDYFKVVGASAGNVKEKVTHKISMLSCAKAKTFDDVKKWSAKIGADKEMFIVQPKIDGMSGNCVYEKGKLVQICTRGDGHIGQDVTHLAKYINVPQTIDIKSERIEIRGEIYLPKNTKAPNPDNKPLRNICVGMVGRKDHKLDDLKHIHFVAYQVMYDNFKSETYKMSWLENNKFEVVKYELLSLDKLEAYRERYVSELREAWFYETDGLIIVVNDNTKWDKINSKYEISHHFYHSVAWKPESESAETELVGAEFQISRSGNLIPIVIFKPVILGGASIARASLTCYDRFLKMKLEKGDRLLISRRNDVIPYCEANITKGVNQKDV
jgi:DNA ligase (NAD+)